MESYFKFLFEVLKQFFGGFWKILSNIFLGLFDIVNLPGYIKELEEYCNGFGALGWILAILTLYSLFIIGFGWMIFFHNDIGEILVYLKQIFGIGTAFSSSSVWNEVIRVLPFIAVCILACTPLPRRLFEKAEEKFTFVTALKPFAITLLFTVCIAYMVDNSFSPFLYYIF